MKAVLIIHGAAIDAEVHEALAAIGVECYSKFTNVLGKGHGSEPHLNTEVWPGVNYGTLAVVEPAKAQQVMQTVRKLRETLGSEGIKAFLWEIEDGT